MIACANGHGPLAKKGTYSRDYLDTEGSHSRRLAVSLSALSTFLDAVLHTFATGFSANISGVGRPPSGIGNTRGLGSAFRRAYCYDGTCVSRTLASGDPCGVLA